MQHIIPPHEPYNPFGWGFLGYDDDVDDDMDVDDEGGGGGGGGPTPVAGEPRRSQRDRNPTAPHPHAVIMNEEEQKALAKKARAKILAENLVTNLEKRSPKTRSTITTIRKNIKTNAESSITLDAEDEEVEDQASSGCVTKTRKSVETVWSELVAAWLFVVPEREKSTIANKETLISSIDKFCNGTDNKITVDQKEGYFDDLRLLSRTWSQIKSYIDKFKLPEEFNANPVLHIWCSGKTITAGTVPSVLNRELPDPKDRQGDFYFQVARPLYPDHPAISIKGRGTAYYGSVNVKTTKNDPVTNFSLYKIISDEDMQICLELFRSTIESVMTRDEILALNRNDMNNEFSIHDHVFWEFIGIILFDPKDNIVAKRLTDCIYATKAQHYYACYKYDGTEITDFQELSENIGSMRTTIKPDVVKTQNSKAAKLFFKLRTFYNNGKFCEEYYGELRFKNPKQCTSKSGHAPQIILTKSNIGGGGGGECICGGGGGCECGGGGESEDGDSERKGKGKGKGAGKSKSKEGKSKSKEGKSKGKSPGIVSKVTSDDREEGGGGPSKSKSKLGGGSRKLKRKSLRKRNTQRRK